MDKRWYDDHRATLETLEMLKGLDKRSRDKLSENIIEVAKELKLMRREEDEPELSLGIQRVLGLYQSSNARRWYDKAGDLTEAFRAISSLPEEDFKNIMEGLATSFVD